MAQFDCCLIVFITMASQVYNNISMAEVAVLGYFAAARDWGVSSNNIPPSFMAGCCKELTWDTAYDILDNTDKVWGVTYYQKV